MGLFSFRKPPARVNSSGSVPHTADLLYPAVLPAFSEIAAGEHRDPRAVFYTIRFMDPQRSRPFTPDVLDASDFGSKAEVRRVLVRRGFVQNADAGRTLSVFYSKDTLKDLLRKRGLPVGGTKEQQAARLLADGFRISPSRRLLELTASGSALIASHGADLTKAIRRATLALKEQDYPGAVAAYRDHDSRWGYVHPSGKAHTIFASYDVPFRRLDFLAGYPMRELYNSEDFRRTLRACLIAGLMRGEQERTELAFRFKEVCQEQIVCPGVLDLFTMDDFDRSTSAAMRAAMEQNVSADSDFTLEYYISHVLYLSRRA